MKGCYCVNGYLFYWLRPAILFIQIYIVEVLTVQHRDTVTMLQVHQDSCVGPHYNQCHQRSVAVIVSTRVLTSSNLAEQSSCAGWHGTTYTGRGGLGLGETQLVSWPMPAYNLPGVLWPDDTESLVFLWCNYSRGTSHVISEVSFAYLGFGIFDNQEITMYITSRVIE